MDWSPFLSGLFEDGRLLMPAFAALSSEDLAQLREALLPYESVARLNLPAGVPAWDPESGSWAAAMLFRSCQFVVYRDLGEQAIEHQLAGDDPAPTPAAHYSVDLCFRYLPDVLAFARSASEQDPLVKRLTEWAQQWPMSSVGVADVQVNPDRLSGVFASPALQQVYVDRILAADDVSRLADQQTVDAVQRVIGSHPDLALTAVRRKLESTKAITTE